MTGHRRRGTLRDHRGLFQCIHLPTWALPFTMCEEDMAPSRGGWAREEGVLLNPGRGSYEAMGPFLHLKVCLSLGENRKVLREQSQRGRYVGEVSPVSVARRERPALQSP